MAFGDTADQGDDKRCKSNSNCSRTCRSKSIACGPNAKTSTRRPENNSKAFLDQDQITRGGLQRLLEPQRLPPEIQQMLGGGMMMGGPGF